MPKGCSLQDAALDDREDAALLPSRGLPVAYAHASPAHSACHAPMHMAWRKAPRVVVVVGGWVGGGWGVWVWVGGVCGCTGRLSHFHSAPHFHAI